ncbi:TraX family protein [Streptococcus sp. X13SY08]|uniref:TraX family protein n=1 Tax=Streptococcus sp. X13SY08 TaxID=1676616 RepID=UPI000AA0C3FD|nr:TraX family protein [Streptococcus sp. X13SY08]
MLPFHYAFDVLRGQPLNWGNNIFFTLVLGLVYLIFYERYRHPIIQFILLIVFTALSFYSDWGPQGVPLIFLFYYMRTQKKRPVFPLIALLLYMSFNYWVAYYQYPGLVSIYLPLSALGILCVIPLLLSYNGERGYSPIWVKWGFYLFYPLHLLLLFAIRFWIYGI